MPLKGKNHGQSGKGQREEHQEPSDDSSDLVRYVRRIRELLERFLVQHQSDSEKRKADTTNSINIQRGAAKWTKIYTSVTAAIFLLAGVQAWIARDVEKRQLRAYIFINLTPPVDLVANKPIIVHLLATNSGQTPVRTLHTRATMLQFGDFQKFYHSIPDVDRLPIIEEGESFSKTHDMQMSSVSNPTDEEIRGIKAGHLFIGFVGVVVYTDIFGDTHRTHFCRYYPGTNAEFTGSCPTGNEAD
jgi:hypothetical protein